jgi:hypothetical protein
MISKRGLLCSSRLTGLSDSSLPALYLLHIHFVLIIIYMEKEAGEGQSHMPEEGGPVSEQVDKNLTGKKSLNTKLLVGRQSQIISLAILQVRASKRYNLRA